MNDLMRDLLCAVRSRRAPPYPQRECLAHIRELAASSHAMPLAQPNYDGLAATVGAFAATVQHADWIGTMRSGERALRAPVDVGGGAFFATLGVAPAIGRAFDAGEYEHVAVVADRAAARVRAARGAGLGRFTAAIARCAKRQHACATSTERSSC